MKTLHKPTFFNQILKNIHAWIERSNQALYDMEVEENWIEVQFQDQVWEQDPVQTLQDLLNL